MKSQIHGTAPPIIAEEVESEEAFEGIPGTINPSGRPLIPEERMWLACLLENLKAPRYVKTDHFKFVCSLLGIDPGYIRRRMQ